MRLCIAFGAFLLAKIVNGVEAANPHQHEGILIQARAQPEPLGWRASVVDKKPLTQKNVPVTVALPHKKTEVHIVKVQLESALSTANPSAERQNDSGSDTSGSVAGAKTLKSESRSRAHHRHRHHQIQNERTKTEQKHHKHKRHRHQKAGNANKQAAGSSSASTSDSSSGSSSGHGFAGVDKHFNGVLRGDAVGDVFQHEADGIVSSQTYNETLIEEEARQVSAAAMTQLADSSPFRLDTSKALVFAAAVAGAVVGIIGVLVAPFGLHRDLVESTERELESDLQDPEAGQVAAGSDAQSQGISSAATGGSSAPASTHSAPDTEAQQGESGVEEERVCANA